MPHTPGAGAGHQSMVLNKKFLPVASFMQDEKDRDTYRVVPGVDVVDVEWYCPWRCWRRATTDEGGMAKYTCYNLGSGRELGVGHRGRRWARGAGVDTPGLPATGGNAGW